MKFLLSIDQFGIPPQIYFKSKTSYSSVVGGISTVLGFFAISAYVVYLLLNLFSMNNLMITQNEISAGQPMVNLTDFPFVFSISDKYGRIFDDTVFRAGAQFWERINDTLKIRNVTIERCDLNKHFGNYQKYFKGIPDLEKNLCIPPQSNNITLYGLFGNRVGGFGFLEVIFVKCFNDGFVPYVSCLNNSIIEKSLGSAVLSYTYLDWEIDHYDIDQPHKLVLKSDLFPVSSTVFKRIFIKKKLVEYISDVGMIFEEFLTYDFFQRIDFVETATDLRNVESNIPIFAQLNFSLLSTKDKYFRKYTKIQFLFANLSLIVKIVYAVVKYFFKFILLKMYYKDMYFNFQKGWGTKSMLCLQLGFKRNYKDSHAFGGKYAAKKNKKEDFTLNSNNRDSNLNKKIKSESIEDKYNENMNNEDENSYYNKNNESNNFALLDNIDTKNNNNKVKKNKQCDNQSHKKLNNISRLRNSWNNNNNNNDKIEFKIERESSKSQ